MKWVEDYDLIMFGVVLLVGLVLPVWLTKKAYYDWFHTKKIAFVKGKLHNKSIQYSGKSGIDKYVTIWDTQEYGTLSSGKEDIFRKAKDISTLEVDINWDPPSIVNIND